MKPLHFFDTNILLYSISTDPSEAEKRDRAIELLDNDHGAMSIQVLQEFYVQATRPSRNGFASHRAAVNLITSWTRFAIQEMTMAVFTRALTIKEVHGFSYWDSAILSAALELECGTLYSEDMSHGKRIDGVLIVNPFGESK